ncbi:glycine-rich cell wall structural protein 1-like [Arachis duranensis]|uniref:Glycine-rich cell wall structural protein 1-like n=1 Tax=Arachis duranensis TaxID=130453 RepID=A0A6P4B3P0_ARADU|nr:glycine-rich cell wall structural protein 1-like [Arachis duranensis]
MARAPYALESDNRWLGGWAPETLLGGLKAVRSWVGSRNAAGWTGGGEAGHGEVGGGSRNAAGWTGGGEVGGGVVRGGSRNAAEWRLGRAPAVGVLLCSAVGFGGTEEGFDLGFGEGFGEGSCRA